MVLGKVIGETLPALWSDDYYNRLPFEKLLVVLAQLRHMRAAERSSKTAIEDQQDVLFTLELG